MDAPDFIQRDAALTIKTIEMHTTGEPTRIVYSGFPDLNGTLLEQRPQALAEHDHIRKAVICEPRGHRDMYGAVLRPHTELVDKGEADMGVLFITNSGYSTMCGHATIAVSRLLVDCAGSGSKLLSDFNLDLKPNHERTEVEVRLHPPCGLVRVSVAIVPISGTDSSQGYKTDITRPISYLSVPSYATGIWVNVPIPQSLRWPELGDRETVVVDIAYGGAFYLISTPSSLGFPCNTLAHPSRDMLAGLSEATRKLKAAFNASELLRKFYLRVEDNVADLQWLYSTIITDSTLGKPGPDTLGAETGLCFFSDAQVDRSPTGSGVQARVALAIAKGRRKIGERWTYHSLVSNVYEGEGAFVGEAVEKVGNGLVVKVSGKARYTGACTFVVEEGDQIGKGFWFDELGESGTSD